MSHPHQTDPPEPTPGMFDRVTDVGLSLVVTALVPIAIGAGCSLTWYLFRTGWRIFS